MSIIKMSNFIKKNQIALFGFILFLMPFLIKDWFLGGVLPILVLISFSIIMVLIFSINFVLFLFKKNKTNMKNYNFLIFLILSSLLTFIFIDNVRIFNSNKDDIFKFSYFLANGDKNFSYLNSENIKISKIKEGSFLATSGIVTIKIKFYYDKNCFFVKSTPYFGGRIDLSKCDFD